MSINELMDKGNMVHMKIEFYLVVQKKMKIAGKHVNLEIEIPQTYSTCLPHMKILALKVCVWGVVVHETRKDTMRN